MVWRDGSAGEGACHKSLTMESDSQTHKKDEIENL